MRKERILLIAVIILNGIFFTGRYFFSEKDAISLITQMYILGEYTPIVENIATPSPLDSHEVEQVVVSMIKLGHYEQAKSFIQQYTEHSTIVTNIYKLLIFREKEDWQSILDIARNYTHKDTKIRSLYLQFRAESSAELDLWDNAIVLAKDSIRLDPLAPSGLVIQAFDYRLNNKYKESLDLFKRAELLGLKLNERGLYERGITEYYTDQREQMREHFESLLEHPEYGYFIHIFLGRDMLEEEYFADALASYEKAGTIDEERWEWKFWIARVYVAQEEYTTALEWYTEVYNKNPRNTELLTDMMKVYYILGDDKKVYSLSLEAKQAAGESVWANATVLGTMHEVRLIADAGEYAKAVMNVAEKEDYQPLREWIGRTIISNLIDALRRQQNFGDRDEELLSYQVFSLKDRDLYIALLLMLQGDEIGALRSLQSFKSNATVRDLQTISTLHHILMNDIVAAIAVVNERERKKPLDLDYLRLKWKLSRMAGEGGAEMNNKTQEVLLVLKNVSQADEANMQDAFEHYYVYRLQYMQQYYPKEE